jgi:hypothetical protein
MQLCQGKKVIPVMSGYMVSKEAEEECRKLGVELFKPHGPGGTYVSSASSGPMM